MSNQSEYVSEATAREVFLWARDGAPLSGRATIEFRNHAKAFDAPDPYSVYFEVNGESFIIRRATLGLAKIEALQQQKLRGGFVTISSKGVEIANVGLDGASWLK